MCTNSMTREYKIFGVFFFFQAEDGIRDIGVTGVQTCALPISTQPQAALPITPADVREYRPDLGPTAHVFAAGYSLRSQVRSEERRVGKESRSRWSPYH